VPFAYYYEVKSRDLTTNIRPLAVMHICKNAVIVGTRTAICMRSDIFRAVVSFA
jgi:hypothetical protein